VGWGRVRLSALILIICLILPLISLLGEVVVAARPLQQVAMVHWL
jgi:hypothetical protein